MNKDSLKQVLPKAALVLLVAIIIVLPLKGSLIEAQDEGVESFVKQQKAAGFLDKIKSEISSAQTQSVAINKNVQDTGDLLNKTHLQVNTLENQLKNLDTQIKDTQAMIANLADQIQRKETEIKKIGYDLEFQELEIANQKKMLTEYIKTLYKERIDVSNGGDIQELSDFKLLLGDDKAGDALKAIKYSEILEETGRDIFNKLEDLIKKQQDEQISLEAGKRKLSLLTNQLNVEKDQLIIQQNAKASLLEQTKGQESIYQQLLDESKKQQEQVMNEIDALRKNMSYIQERMATLGEKFDPADYANLLTSNADKEIYSYLEGSQGLGAGAVLAWPISPFRGISAYYRDKDYVKVIGMQHNAIDIRTPQSTPIKAPAAGVVYKAVDNGYGYSYIILAHGGGLMTVYGHVSRIDVKPGQTINAGDVIGLSGATPGSKGAGVYTTGPHLHFEVLDGGKHVDPLDYLNLAYLPFESLPEKYLAKALGDKQKVKREKDEESGYSTEDGLANLVEQGGLSENATQAVQAAGSDNISSGN